MLGSLEEGTRDVSDLADKGAIRQICESYPAGTCLVSRISGRVIILLLVSVKMISQTKGRFAKFANLTRQAHVLCPSAPLRGLKSEEMS